MAVGLTCRYNTIRLLLLLIAVSLVSAWPRHGGFGGGNGGNGGGDGSGDDSGNDSGNSDSNGATTSSVIGAATTILTSGLPTATSSGGRGGSGSESESIYGYAAEQAERYRAIHGVLAAIAFIIFFPMGGIIVRIVPGRWAMKLHALAQIIGFGIFFGAAALGFWILANFKPRGTSLLSYSKVNYHPILGILIFLLLLSMPVLGVLHHSKYKKTGGRTAVSYVHIWLGRALITVGIINGGLGLHVSGADHDMKVAYAIVAAIVWALWMFALVLGETRRRKERGDAGATMMTTARVRETPVQRYMRERAEREREEELQARNVARRASSTSGSDESPPYTDAPAYAPGTAITTGSATAQQMKLRDDVSEISSRT